MKNRFSLGLAALAAANIGLLSSIPAPTVLAQNAKLKVAFIYIGPPGDFGWTYAHEQGRLALEKALPDVETTSRIRLQELDCKNWTARIGPQELDRKNWQDSTRKLA